MDTQNKTPITPLTAGVKPRPPVATVTKKAYVPRPHLTQRPFEDIKRLLKTAK